MGDHTCWQGRVGGAQEGVDTWTKTWSQREGVRLGALPRPLFPGVLENTNSVVSSQFSLGRRSAVMLDAQQRP